MEDPPRLWEHSNSPGLDITATASPCNVKLGLYKMVLTGATTVDQKVLKINEYKVYKVYNTQMVKVFSVQKKTMKFCDF